MTAWTNYRGQARGLRGRGCRRAAGQSVQQAPGAPARSSHRTRGRVILPRPKAPPGHAHGSRRATFWPGPPAARTQKSANGAPRRGTKSGARSAAAAQVLGMGTFTAIPTSNALAPPPVAPLAARATMGATTHFPIGASERTTTVMRGCVSGYRNCSADLGFCPSALLRHW